MAFDVIPAIDISGGRLARLGREGPEPVKAFGGEPVAAAEAYVSAGARWLHVVDLDLAVTGNPLNIGTIMAIRRVALFGGAQVQVSGAITARQDVEYLRDVGAARVVLGSAALAEPAAVRTLIEEHGDHLAVGIEVDGARIRSRGRDPVDLPLVETLAWLRNTPPARFVLTAVARVGALAGPDLEALEAVRALGPPVVAAGGIASASDLRRLRDAGAEAAIVGRAALDGELDVLAALATRDG